MASIAAKEVAKEVLKTIGKGGKPNISKIGVEKGYTKSSAAAGRIQKTKTYQAELKPVLDRLVEERDRAIKALAGKISKAKYRDLTDSIDKFTKNIQLLNGGKTSNDAVKISWE